MDRNTRIDYLYRDGANYKTSHFAIFRGACDEAGQQRFMKALFEADQDECGRFIPGQVGLKDLQDQFNLSRVALIDELIASGSPESGPVKVGLDVEDIERLTLARKDMLEQPQYWDPDQDHPFHEVTKLSLTDEAPNDPRSIEEFISEVEGVSWDEGYLPPFHAELLENFEARQLAMDEDTPSIG